MMMSNLEIASTYRQAKQPLKQIGILAELNGVSQKEIAEILREQGCELPVRYQDKREKILRSAQDDEGERIAAAPAAPRNDEDNEHLISQPAADSFPSRGSQDTLRKLKKLLQFVILLEEWLEADDG